MRNGKLSKSSPKADELRTEYDLHDLLKKSVKGKYAKAYRSGTNLVLLEPDVRRVFQSQRAVNEALRLVIRLQKLRGGD